MLFNSLSFFCFLPIVFILYWSLKKSLKIQNIILLIASYYFYSCWNWRFLFLLIFSTLLDYFSGILIARTNLRSKKTMLLIISITINLGFLCVFKYYNFFIQSFANFTETIGFAIYPKILNIILPVGISFYTFHGISYVVDIYNKKIEPEKLFINYVLFVCYFPLLVAGPIEKATHLLPQINNNENLIMQKLF